MSPLCPVQFQGSGCSQKSKGNKQARTYNSEATGEQVSCAPPPRETPERPFFHPISREATELCKQPEDYISMWREMRGNAIKFASSKERYPQFSLNCT